MSRQYLFLLWGVLLGAPLLALGAWMHQTAGTLPAGTGYPFVVLGVFAIALGAYVTYAAPESESYNTVVVFEPTNLLAYAYAVFSFASLAVTLYLLYGTEVPYLWPGLAFLVFLVGYLKALFLLFKNMLTTYYVTPDRLISEYRFLSLTRTSFEHEDVTNVTRRQSALETLLGLGTVRVSVPSGTITLDNLRNPDEAEEVLNSKRM